MTMAIPKPVLPSDDKRWKIVDATMRRHGYVGNALIETLHTAQESFGYLDDITMRFVARSLKLPLSKVFGVATFYHHFQLKPQGKHTCVVCMGTACYIKGGAQLIKGIEDRFDIKPGQTTADGEISLLEARCIGSCGLAPAAVFDGEMIGKLDPAKTLERIEKLVGEQS